MKERAKERNYRLLLSLLRVTGQILVLYLIVDNPLKVWQCSVFSLRQGENISFFSVVLQPIQFSVQQEQDILSDMESSWGEKLAVHLPSLPAL